jgi:hypothetical protein
LSLREVRILHSSSVSLRIRSTGHCQQNRFQWPEDPSSKAKNGKESGRDMLLSQSMPKFTAMAPPDPSLDGAENLSGY